MVSRLLCAALLVTLFVGLAQLPLHADEPADRRLRPEDRAFFGWWDSLKYPDVRSLPFVAVTTGGWTQVAGEDPEPELEHGFLVSEAAGTIRVFLTDLSTLVLTLRAVPDEPWKSIRKRKADFERYVTQGLTARRAHTEAGPRLGRGVDPFRAHRWAVPDQSWRMCVLARACAARGHEAQARSLCDLAFEEGNHPVEGGGPGRGARARFYAHVRAAIAAEAWRVWQKEFESADVTLEALARDAERLGQGLEPGTRGLTSPGRWTRAAAGLRTAARDVATHLARRAAAGPPASEQERSADLVAQLPTERGRWICGALAWSKRPPTLVDELVAIGLPAVPALIGALSDVRFTRRLEHIYTYRGQRRDDWRVMRVNEAAYAALRCVAAGALPEVGGRVGFPAVSSPEHGVAVARVRAWHEQVLEQGQVAILVEIASRGDRTSYTAANRLAQLDPAAAVAPTVKGIRAARHASFRHNLVLVLARLPGEAGWSAIESLLSETEDVAVRFTAAQALLHRKPEASVPVFIEVWQRPLPAPVVHQPSVPGSPLIQDHEARRRREHALFLLAASGEANAIEALEAGLAARSGRARLAGIVALVAPNALAAFQLLPVGFGGANAVELRPMSTEALAVVERTLAGRLEDATRVGRLDVMIDGVWLDPVIGEVAAWGLARRFPERWTFDPRASAESRSRARLIAANAWRKRHGKPPLPLPKPHARPKAVALGEVRGQFLQAAMGTDARIRARTLSALGARGLAVLPALREGLRMVTQEAPGRAALDALVRRLSLTVSEVEFAKDAPVPGETLRALVGEKIGHVLSGDLYASIFLHVAGHMPPGAAGLRLVALREDPAVGVRLVVELIKDKVPASGTQTGWNASGPAVQVGERRDGGGGSFLSWDYGRTTKAWAAWAQRIDASLAKGALDDRITIRGLLVGTK